MQVEIHWLTQNVIVIVNKKPWTALCHLTNELVPLNGRIILLRYVILKTTVVDTWALCVKKLICMCMNVTQITFFLQMGFMMEYHLNAYYIKYMYTISNLLFKSWRFGVIWRLPQKREWVDSSPWSVISVETSWLTEKKLVKTGRQEVRPCSEESVTSAFK